ncbi:FtsK/SpoIIIE family protein [Lactococcus cremoris]|uniref:FtsK/SpoIIIE family protein n=1 Tax=Lactococcus lactis subsp. cremoris TaxID=1359 RepID=A0A166IRU3_LACLC|nr:hypothetical protein [Lactococcus cremoris]KZK04791.1 FtsK/SpoIIIE family protein [Lactococcus cremoris]
MLFDEWAAFISSLDYREFDEVIQILTQIVLKGRQSGVFLILTVQRPDAECLKSVLRDNFMKWLAVGRLTGLGYWMIFGNEHKKKFSNISKTKLDVVMLRIMVNLQVNFIVPQFH